jgi:cytochrome c5
MAARIANPVSPDRRTRRPARRIFVAALLSLAAQLASAAAATAPSGCVSIDSVPYVATAGFEADIQPIFNARCIGCHGANSTHIDLTPANAASSLQWPSTQNPSLQRVVPGHPALSLLQGKVQCMAPQTGGPMPPGGPLLLADIALIHDWILNGALSRGTDRISFGGFESRTSSAVARRAPTDDQALLLPGWGAKEAGVARGIDTRQRATDAPLDGIFFLGGDGHADRDEE